jgi:hypothetical protein
MNLSKAATARPGPPPPQVMAASPPSGPTRVTPANPSVAATTSGDGALKDAIEETAELYLWLGATGELEEARELVLERCHDRGVGQVVAVTFLEQPFELTESQVIAKRVRTRTATVAYDLTGTLDLEGDGGDPIASTVNLTGELQLVRTEEGWFVSCLK